MPQPDAIEITLLRGLARARPHGLMIDTRLVPVLLEQRLVDLGLISRTAWNIKITDAGLAWLAALPPEP